MEPRHRRVAYLLAGAFHDMAYLDWGDPAAPAVVCVHGLTRNAHDFDALARVLAPDFRVICPDLPGRGGSVWLPDPALYQPMNYVLALSHLLSATGEPVSWVGTSLGGVCGMAIAAAPGQPITRMVLNDIGPFIPEAALASIGSRIARVPDFADMQEAEAYIRMAHATFGKLTDHQWAEMTRYSMRTLPNGRLAVHYDPGITTAMLSTPPANVDLWALWDKITIPALVLRGADSELLLPETLARMEESGARSLVVPECGHAPAMMDAPTIEAVRAFLSAR
ncbi:MAG TPA: alpha/beta hydrolase [Acetobacteraceae bacterium]|jgi:pimeloyl-ACP methyl ester carboxylesterase